MDVMQTLRLKVLAYEYGKRNIEEVRSIYSQDPESKHYVKSNLFLSFELQFPDFGDRESDYEDVLKDIECAIGPGCRVEVDAFPTMQILVPDV